MHGELVGTAESVLRAHGFDNIDLQYDCYGIPVNDVGVQTPSAGYLILTTSPETLVLQAGNCAVVPNVVGLTMTAADASLRQDGFTDVVNEFDGGATQACGPTVWQTLPTPGNDHPKSQEVVVQVKCP